MKRLIGIILGTLVIASIYIFSNLALFSSKQSKVEIIPKAHVNKDAAKHLSEAIKIKTISYDDPAALDSASFFQFLAFLKETYPNSFKTTTHHLFGRFTMLIEWKGSNPSLKPIILMSHYDVVPVPEENKFEWKEDPFGGVIKDGLIWGRGAIDDKVGVIGICEAVENLIISGFKPERTIYLSFGHDEEVMGVNGASQVAHYLKQKGVEAEFVLDEGGYITQGLVPGMSQDVALIGTTEKGYLTLELSTKIEGGHASMPKPETAIDVISKAITNIKKNPFPSYISPPLRNFIDYVGPEMPLGFEIVFSNADLLEPVLMSVYEKSPSSNALVRTTVAPTIIQGGAKNNVLPTHAKAVLNIRILPGESIDYVYEYIKESINDDKVHLRILNKSEAAIVSDVNSPNYITLDKSIKQIFGDIVISPYIMIAASDSRYFTEISSNVYRFCPFHLNKKNLKTFHGTNERIGVEEFNNAIRFYAQLIKNSTK
ncbi:M20 family peptidase [Flammeovirga kamogawensis]|uniref:M20 family peptidase n=1 Tax=Flammeovirga kamogawensis TaxID=373891 RepID=A0ABX8H167_9BACT|nr:M20 family peptidase [Flammeovirga kamogawensis]MBB6459343.1 carboxypeptidase PM20D1 [Flammeovirga kamogawensis]QWG08900.1 M20 family peptidase [Flammeovirga kamogawensis]TRX67191.1 M20/M25/M40 family metallo-hydrolase [Flammeovirga kamogawensis]